MRIERVEAWPIHLRLNEPYRLASQHVSGVTNLLVRVIPDRGHVGHGCGAPEPIVTGERWEDTLQALREVVPERVQGLDPRLRVKVGEAIQDLGPAVRAAVGMACLDLIGRHLDCPVWQLLGGVRRAVPTCFTLPIEDLESVRERARGAVGRGFGLLKLKGGLDVDADVAALTALRSDLGHSVELLFDGNQGYSLEDARRFLHTIGPIGLRLVEQPVRVGEMPKLIGEGQTPLCVDEGIVTLANVWDVARRRHADAVNLKLMKLGGVEETLRALGVARATGLDVLLGCMDECALSIAASLHVALARPEVDLVDLDGHLDLVDDPTRGCVVLERGCLLPSARPGLGLLGPLSP